VNNRLSFSKCIYKKSCNRLSYLDTHDESQPPPSPTMFNSSYNLARTQYTIQSNELNNNKDGKVNAQEQVDYNISFLMTSSNSSRNPCHFHMHASLRFS